MHYKKNKLFATVLAAACLGVLLPEGSEAWGRPEVDTTRSRPCTVISKETLERIPPAEQSFFELASTATITTEVTPKGNPTRVTFEANGLNFTAPVRKFNSSNCSFAAWTNKVNFSSGHTANVRLDWRTKPEPRMSVSLNKIRLGGQYFAQEVWDFKWTLATDTSNPPPPPPRQEVVPPPPQPGPPAPPTQQSGFRTPDGVVLLGGTKVNLTKEVDLHSLEECKLHTVTDSGGVERPMCIYAQAPTALDISNANEKGFDLRRTLPTGSGWEWKVMNCNFMAGALGCSVDGLFHKEPIRVEAGEVKEFPGTSNFSARMSIETMKNKNKFWLTLSGEYLVPKP